VVLAFFEVCPVQHDALLYLVEVEVEERRARLGGFSRRDGLIV